MNDNTPILVGSAQVTLREIASPGECRSPVELAAQAVANAVGESGLPKEAIDTLVMTRQFIDCVDAYEHPFGTSSKPPLSVARHAGLAVRRAVYGPEGGQSPQRFVNEFAESIYTGESGAVVICGAEATAAMRQALGNGWTLDWREDPPGEMEDRGFGQIMNALELRHDITFPPQVYALFENAWRHKHGLSVAEHRQLMARLFARFSEIAAGNPYAQFPVARSVEFLATPSPENYAFNEPYNKWMVAQDRVNQAAALVLTSVGNARKLGIPESRWLYLHGYADADDAFVSQRADLARSVALEAAGQQALKMANRGVDDIALLDIYSCFPIAVLAACDALGIPWDGDRDLTVTGGLPFFGGPGNSYSVNAIAEMYQQLIARPGAFGLVSANGGYLSKESVGIYSTTPHQHWMPANAGAAQEIADASPRETVLSSYSGEAVIESYCVVYKKSAPALGLAVCREPVANKRVLAKVGRNDQATLAALLEKEPIGRIITVSSEGGDNYLRFA